jgi:hypothetical protein
MPTSFSLALLWKYRKSKFGIDTELQGTECPLLADSVAKVPMKGARGLWEYVR